MGPFRAAHEVVLPGHNGLSNVRLPPPERTQTLTVATQTVGTEAASVEIPWCSWYRIPCFALL